MKIEEKGRMERERMLNSSCVGEWKKQVKFDEQKKKFRDDIR